MQATKDTAVAMRVMIVDDSIENAEAVISALRNGGVAVRPLRPQSHEEITQMINSQPIDLALVSGSHQFPQALVDKLIDASGKDIPLIALVESINDAAMLEAMKNGARAVALKWQPEHLLSVLQAERAELENRRRLRRLEVMLRETDRRCDALIASSRDPIAYIHDGMHVRANDAYLAMFGFESFEDMEGLPLLDLVAPQNVENFKQLLKTLAKGGTAPPEYRVHLRLDDGTTFPAKLEFASASYEGEASLQVVIRRNEEVDPELAREVEELRLRDPVTGLLNRPSFLRILEDTVAQVGRGEGGNYGFLLIEPDHYMQLLNDIGLDSADAFVAELSVHLSAILTGDEEMQVARFGEQTFAVLMQGGYAHTDEVAEKVRTAFASQVFNVGARSASVTVSIGGVQVGEKIASLNSVLTRAAESLQTVQDDGGNAVRIFDPGASDRIEEERVGRWVARIRDALAGEGFVLYFQPVISLQGEPCEFYEVFLRMNVNDELISPNSFIHIAEDNGLLELVDMWVIKHAIMAIGERKRMGRTTRLLAKLSPGSFSNPNLVHMIERELAVHGVSGDMLWLQTAEAKVFTHLRSAQEFAKALVPLGCKMGLEQFGSGLDSFQLLNHLRPAFIKIDHGFTDDLSKSAELQEKVAGFAQRAHEEKIYALAEWVRDAAVMTQLFSAGIDYVSGEFISMPMPTMNFDFS